MILYFRLSNIIRGDAGEMYAIAARPGMRRPQAVFLPVMIFAKGGRYYV